MKCKLCLKEKKLLKKSHIIPDFMYKELYDDQHFIYKVDIGSGKKPTKIPTGEYDSNILCENCDNKIINQKYEDYASKVFYGSPKETSIQGRREKSPNSVLEWTFIKNISYQKFKLFLLCLLWKSSISKRNYFNEIKLGHYEEKLRNMILKSEPMDKYDFPCIIFHIKHDELDANQIVRIPYKNKTGELDIYNFFIGGLLYIFYVPTRDKKPDFLFEGVIDPNNTIKIFHLDRKNTKIIDKLIF